MLTIQNISFSIDGKPLFKEASASIPTGHKVGMVGRNGTGKTTLFRLIKKEWMIDSGKIEVPRNFRIGGVDQEAPATNLSLIETVMNADKERSSLLKEAETASNPNRIAEIQIRLADIDAFSAESRASIILTGLGFSNKDQKKPCCEFSGGWRMRVALGAVLFSQPDVLLLDEPTNYLDLEGSIWLENFLSKYPHTILVISHDRELLNKSVNGILHLANLKLTYYSGNYNQFDKERRLKLEQQLSMKKKQDAQRVHIQSFVDRFRYKASKARQAQSRLKQLEKMQPISALSENSVASFNFPSPKELPPPIINIEKGSVGYNGEAVLRNINLFLDQDDRIALLGANGEGKSTLSKLLASRLNLLQGRFLKSSKLKVGFFAQHQLEELIPSESPLQHIMKFTEGESISKLRSRLGTAGIGADIVENPVENLSGGQKARLLMTLATIQAPHLLILDEPTNHLDIESREALMHALNDFSGAVILVSHDSHLVEMVADRLWLVQNGEVKIYEGDMIEYKKLLLSQRASRDKDKKNENKNLNAKEENVFSKSNSEILNSEKKISRLEKERDDIKKTLSEAEIYKKLENYKINQLVKKLDNVILKLEDEEKNWLKLNSYE